MIKLRKLKLFGHICRMKDERLVKAVMLGMIEVIDVVEDQQEDDMGKNDRPDGPHGPCVLMHE